MQPMPIVAAPVRFGPRAYRHRIRTFGPLLGLLPAVVLGIASWLLLHENTSAARGVLGFVAALLAAPGLLLAGAPLARSAGLYAAAVAGSTLVWLLVGLAASRRSTRSPVATWGDYWKEFLWLGGALWLGVAGSLLAANLVLGGAFL